jgi:hypothetical protein
MSTPVKYDPNVIQKFADALYRQAGRIVLRWIILGAFVSAALGLSVKALPSDWTANAWVPAIMLCLALVGGVIGWQIGSAKAFVFRLHAQTALCQVAIESNTRTQLKEAVTV